MPQPSRKPSSEPDQPDVRPVMSESDIRAAGGGLAIDVPYEAPPARPDRLKYATDLGPEFEWSGGAPDFSQVPQPESESEQPPGPPASEKTNAEEDGSTK